MSLAGVPPSNVLVDLDKPGKHVNVRATRCEYLFIGEQDDAAWLALLELKSGRADASTFKKQLQAGAKIADRILPADAIVILRPLAVHGRELRPVETHKLTKSQIRFRGKKANITSIIPFERN